MDVLKVLVVGSGSAGLIAALALKRRLPELEVTVVSSTFIGIIGVGEGTVPSVPSFFHQYLGLSEHEVFQAIDPVFKLGVRFNWGRRDYFDYTFSNQQWAWTSPSLGRPSGFFAEFGHHGIDLAGALMEAGHAVPSRGGDFPDVPPPGSIVAWHLENHRFVAWLETVCQQQGVELHEGDLDEVERLETGDLSAIRFKDGSRRAADLFIDATGFRSELLARTLGEPFVAYSDVLFNDRAIVGGWERAVNEPVLPYTVSDSLRAGWSWRIDHPSRINRGYVFSSSHISEDEAEAEFRKLNPRIGETRVVKYRSGRHRRLWVGNVVAIGNSGAFMEPLEATAIMCICLQTRWLVDGLIDSQRRPTDSMKDLYNGYTARLWDEIREFLALHYKLNDRLDTPYWRACREEVRLGFSGELARFYRENGPSRIGSVLIPKDSPFGLEGYYAILVGMGAPMEKRGDPAEELRTKWEEHLRRLRAVAANGMTMETAREKLRDPAVWKAIRQHV